MHPVRSYSFLAASRRSESSSSTSEPRLQIAPSAALRPTNTPLLSGDPQLVVLDPQQDFIANLNPHCFPKSRRDHHSSVLAHSHTSLFHHGTFRSVCHYSIILPLMNKSSTQALVRHRTVLLASH